MLSEKPWKPERVVLLLLGTAVCFSGFSLVYGLAEHFNGGQKLDDNSLASLVLNTMSLHGSILLATSLLLWWSRISWREAFGFLTGDTGRAMLLGLLAAAVFLPVGWMLQLLTKEFMHMLHPDAQVPVQQAVEMLQNTETWGSRTYFILFSILIAPAAEEILFRGILYPAIKQAGFPRAALWGTAMVFAAIHQNAPIFLPLLALGLALALLYEATNNLLACITAHGVFNAVNIVVLFHQNSSPRLHG